MIFTFYSFKGGVGRSMALANVAEILYRRGLRVVMVDWDLEAPGLEKYFFNDPDDIAMVQSQPGLIDLLLRYKKRFHTLNFEEVRETVAAAGSFERPAPVIDSPTVVEQLKTQLEPVHPLLHQIHKSESGGALYLLSAGLQYGDYFSSYAQAVQGFDWAEFYSEYEGEAYFEWLRSQLLDKNFADIVLIDSRTGVTEMGGVCTRQLADCVVMLVAPNEQNLVGTVMMARSLTRPELKETRGGKTLPLVFVPSRIEDSEGELLAQFAQQFRDKLAPFITPALVKDVFLDLKIRYVPYFAYMESLAVDDAKNPVAADLVGAYERLAETLSKVAPVGHSLRRSYRPAQPSGIGLPDILNTARQESFQMRHYYLGVEHIFIALAQIRGGLVSRVLEKNGMTTAYVIDVIRQKFGKGSRQRLWAGVPNTPRLEKVLGAAAGLAKENEREVPDERDLFIALLRERRNTVVRVLENLKLDIDQLIETAEQTTPKDDAASLILVRVDYGDEYTGNQLTKDETAILRRAFYGYAKVKVLRRLSTNSSKNILLLVLPVMPDDRSDAPVAVKIGYVADILSEAQRYERYVRNTLPPLTARIENKPTTLDTSDLAAIKYSLISTPEQEPRTFSDLLNLWTGEALARWIKEVLYPTYTAWWQQNRPYRFMAWHEYDWMLPPVLTLDQMMERQAPSTAITLKFPIRRQRLEQIEVGDVVVVENFMVRKIDPEKNILQLALGINTTSEMAYKIDVRGLDLTRDMYYRGEVVERVAGTVWKTRDEEILTAIRALEPDFDVNSSSFKIGKLNLPNPMRDYSRLLEFSLNGTMCTIHGNFIPSNILVGPGNSAMLTDFADTRDGHAIFDWVTLELSLITHAAASLHSWDELKALALELFSFYQADQSQDTPLLQGIFQPLQAIRQISRELLANDSDWTEYYLALSLIALRGVTRLWKPMNERRMMLLVSTIALQRVLVYERDTTADIASMDETDNNLE